MATKVGVEDKQGKLRLRLPRVIVSGSQRYISTGLDNTTDNWKKAQVVAWTIEEDIRAGTLDTTLERYKQAFRPKQTIQKQPDLMELWLAFVDYKRSQVAETTWLKNYKRKLTNYIQSLPSHKLTDASLIRSHLLSHHPASVAKLVFRYLSACCRWAKVEDHFGELGRDIRERKYKLTIQPFTVAERQNILDYFSEHQPHYLSFVPLVPLFHKR